jgi:hypothetical protein
LSFKQKYPANNGSGRFYANPRAVSDVGGEYAVYMMANDPYMMAKSHGTLAKPAFGGLSSLSKP